MKVFIQNIIQKFKPPVNTEFEKQKTKIAELTSEFHEANKTLAITEHRFENAEPEMVEAISYEIKAIEMRRDVLLHEIKQIQNQMN